MTFLQPKLENTDFPNIAGKSVLVVGGTSGMGKAVAIICKDLGADVTVIGRNRCDLDVLQITEDVVENPDKIEPYFIGKNYVFNNIGFYYQGTILETDTNTFLRVINRNLTIAHILTRYALKHVKEVVVNMSSRPTLEKYHSWSAYTLAKQGVITLTQAAAEEGSIKCYAVCPSRVDTKFRDALFPDENKDTRLSPEAVAELVVRLFNGKNPNGQHYWVKQLTNQTKSCYTAN